MFQLYIIVFFFLDCAKVSNQEINFLLVVYLVKCLAESTVRLYFDTEFNPDILTDIIRKNTTALEKLKRKNRINKTQFCQLTKGLHNYFISSIYKIFFHIVSVF